mgnify:CR=1 FL=1
MHPHEESAALSIERRAQIEASLEQTRQRLVQLNHRTVTFVRNNPIPCAIGALALGYLVGRAAARRWLW